MKKMKALTALMLAVLLLTACVQAPAAGTTAPVVTTQQQETTTAPTKRPVFQIPTEPEPDPVITELYLPAEVDNPDGLPVLSWVCLSDGFVLDPDRRWREDALVELNQMLAEKNVPFRIQFRILFSDQNMWPLKWFSAQGAQEALESADLIWGYMRGEQMQQYLMPITRYVEGSAELSLADLVPHPVNWSAATVDGEIYGAPAEVLQPKTFGWRVDPAFLRKYDLTPEQFLEAGTEPDALFAEIYKKTGGKPFLQVDTNGFAVGSETNSCRPLSLVSFLATSHLIGGCFAVDYSGDGPKVVNYLETEAVQSFHAALMRYQKAGYVGDDFSPVQLSNYSSDSICEDYGSIYIPVTEPVYTQTAPRCYVNGIAAGSEHPEGALSLLDLIANNEEFRMQLFYGKEGRDYAVEDGEYVLIKGEDGANYSLSCLLPGSRFCGLYTQDWDPDAWGATPMPTKGGMDELETYRGLMDSSFLVCPVTFDFAAVSAEQAALESEMERYFPRFLETEKKGNTLPFDEGGYEQMLQAFRDAGSETIQAELQRQLDAWLEANPDWAP